MLIVILLLRPVSCGCVLVTYRWGGLRQKGAKFCFFWGLGVLGNSSRIGLPCESQRLLHVYRRLLWSVPQAWCLSDLLRTAYTRLSHCVSITNDIVWEPDRLSLKLSPDHRLLWDFVINILILFLRTNFEFAGPLCAMLLQDLQIIIYWYILSHSLLDCPLIDGPSLADFWAWETEAVAFFLVVTYVRATDGIVQIFATFSGISTVVPFQVQDVIILCNLDTALHLEVMRSLLVFHF